MPIHNIETKEYECGHCGYRWTNRINGNDSPIPKKCAKCKRTNWNDPNEAFTPEEIGLRRKIKGFRDVYYYQRNIDWPYDLSDVFLQIKNPRPTYKQLKKIVYPFGDLDRWKWVSCPDRPGWSMRNPNMGEIRKNEAEERKRLMLELMKERRINYDVSHGIQRMKEHKKCCALERI
ncbi:MAG: hypothetical protein ACRD8W_07735 [Nitrososphaeraceae archaeon]